VPCRICAGCFGPLPSNLRFYSHQQFRSGKQQIGNQTLSPIRFGQPLNAVQKLIRLAAIGLMMLIGYKGVHASPRPAKQLAARDAQIAASDAQNADLLKLTKSLLERNPSWAGANPQTVGEAVQSIVQGASEGDRRLQRLWCKLSQPTQRSAREHYAAHAARTAFQISGAVLPLMRSSPSLN
jgi:hypothetical protein